ncbi:DUF1569 domain-containing protein [Parapedobacter sp. GCM10030251]|uniref:DUF1569 domain-containing protein n=1 Tax=Parapedobacter sp. GCM10030251 TaxID=3273419 RepID=UPI0036169A01
MKTVFDKSIQDELADRVRLLKENSHRNWGKMTAYQMAKHCNNWSEWVLGVGSYANHVYKQDFLGKLFGKAALKSNVKDDRPMGKNMPAGIHVIKKTETGDLEVEKARWLRLITEYDRFRNDRFIHDFFGKMTKEQIGIFAYKHFDHHLRQFGI